MGEISSSATPTRRRSLLRLHWLSWLALIAASLIVLFLEVPGLGVTPTLLKAKPYAWGQVGGTSNLPNPDEVEGPLTVREYEHGWPATYLRRAVGFGGKGWPKHVMETPLILSANNSNIAPWDIRQCWSFLGQSRDWQLGALLLDVCIALALVVSSTMACEHWIRRRGGRLRFRTIDFLAITLVAAGIFGWRQWHLRQRGFEEQLVASLLPIEQSPYKNISGSYVPVRGYRGPRWLERLIFVDRISFLSHRVSLSLVTESMSQTQWEALPDAKYVEHAYAAGHLPDEGLSALEKMPSLRAFEGLGPTDASYQFARLGEQGKAFSRLHIIPPERLPELSRLKQLEVLRLRDPNLLIEDLEPVAALQTLKEIDLRGIMATMEEQRRFQKAHPQLVVHCDDSQQRGFPSTSADAWTVAQHRVLRWRISDSGTVGETIFQEHGLDLQGVRLTDERRLKIAPVLPTVTRLLLDGNTEPAQVIQLVRDCPKLEFFRAHDLPATDSLLKHLAGIPTLTEIAVAQREATLDGFLELQRLNKLEWLEIRQAKLSANELDRLREELGADVWLEIELLDKAPEPKEINPFE